MVDSETSLCALGVSQGTIVVNIPIFRYHAANYNTIGYKKIETPYQAHTFNQRFTSSNNNDMHRLPH